MEIDIPHDHTCLGRGKPRLQALSSSSIERKRMPTSKYRLVISSQMKIGRFLCDKGLLQMLGTGEVVQIQ
jgi:hypothetical protein